MIKKIKNDFFFQFLGESDHQLNFEIGTNQTSTKVKIPLSLKVDSGSPLTVQISNFNFGFAQLFFQKIFGTHFEFKF